MPEDILPIREVADHLTVTERTLYRLAQAGKVPPFTVGSPWRLGRADIDAWIREQRTMRRDEGGSND